MLVDGDIDVIRTELRMGNGGLWIHGRISCGFRLKNGVDGGPCMSNTTLPDNES